MKKKQFVDPKNARSAKYRKILEELGQADECPAPFCKDTDWNHPDPPLLYGRNWKVTENAYNSQGAEHKFLFVYNEHVTEFRDVNILAWSELYMLINMMLEKHQADSSTLILRNGKTNYSGASVCHLHAQLIIGCDRDEGPDVIPMDATIGFQHSK